MVLMLLTTATAAEGDAAAEAHFKEYVLPMFQQHRNEYHSHATGKAKLGLVLDSRSGWVKGGDSGPAVVPGKSDERLPLSAFRYEDHEMPPTGKLPDELIARLQHWVAHGTYDRRVMEPINQLPNSSTISSSVGLLKEILA